MSAKNPAAMGGNNVLAAAYNAVDESLSTSTFVTAVVGRKIEITAISGTVDDIIHSQSGTVLYTLRVTYNNSAHDSVVSIERTN